MSFILIILLSFPVMSATCKKLSECVELSSKITGKSIVYDKKILPFTYELNRPIEINKENVDKSLSEALNIFGLAKIPSQMKNTDRVIEARDIRFHTDVPVVEASKNKTPSLPENHDPISLNYKAVKGADVEVIEEKIRPLLSRYGRAMPMRDGTLVVIDLSSHIKKILPLIQKQDYPLTAEEKSEMALEKKRAHELELARMKSSDLHEIGPHKEHKH